jgi:hypothetical protein
MSLPLLSKPESDSSLYSEDDTSAKVTVSLCVLKVFFLCPTCHFLARITFATFAVKWY